MKRMTERKGGCFNCGGEGHFARACPDSTTSSTQRKRPPLAEAPASIAATVGTSPGSAKSRKERGGPERKGPEKNAGNALREETERRGEKEERELLVPKDTKRKDGNTVPDAKKASARREGSNAVSKTCSASTATNPATLPEPAPMVNPDPFRQAR